MLKILRRLLGLRPAARVDYDDEVNTLVKLRERADAAERELEWCPLTDDPATWPKEGQRCLFFSDEARRRGTTYGLFEVGLFYEDRNRRWWTRWKPLTEPR